MTAAVAGSRSGRSGGPGTSMRSSFSSVLMALDLAGLRRLVPEPLDEALDVGDVRAWRSARECSRASRSSVARQLGERRTPSPCPRQLDDPFGTASMKSWLTKSTGAGIRGRCPQPSRCRCRGGWSARRVEDVGLGQERRPRAAHPRTVGEGRAASPGEAQPGQHPVGGGLDGSPERLEPALRLARHGQRRSTAARGGQVVVQPGQRCSSSCTSGRPASTSSSTEPSRHSVISWDR